MFKRNKILGQLTSIAGNHLVLYTTPASTLTFLTKLSICDRGDESLHSKYHIAIVPAGETLEPKHYFHYNVYANRRDTIGLDFLSYPGTQIVVWSDTSHLSYTLWGIEDL